MITLCFFRVPFEIHNEGTFISVTHTPHEVDKGPGTMRNSFYGHEEPIYGSIGATKDYIYTINKLIQVSLSAPYPQTLLAEVQQRGYRREWYHRSEL